MKLMRAYISVSFSKRQAFNEAISVIVNELNRFNIEPFIFVDNYHFTPGQEKQMMQQATLDMDRSDLLIAETSDKGIGIGIEVGYAKAKGKPVIYVRQSNAEHSTTTAGISDFQIIYDNAIALQQQLQQVMSELIVNP